MDKHKVYCDECAHLKLRPVKAEVPMDSGNYIVTGERYYCAKHDKWYPLNTTPEQIGFSACLYGEKMKQK